MGPTAIAPKSTIPTNNNVNTSFNTPTESGGTNDSSLRTGKADGANPIKWGGPEQQSPGSQKAQGKENSGETMKDKIMEILMMIIQLIMMMLQKGNEAGDKKGSEGGTPGVDGASPIGQGGQSDLNGLRKTEMV
ncbi:hypothetical protein [Agarilytica rhodophyticola]|uniref:hypothetical protein n=1 Tax=Agarilytica rhodophyticola TaxID=1737490 RepID=UPI000B346556|nr:hypothetical protein [Agarilytica rhodophyticola]